jgi:hypothetical protein
MAQMQSLLPGAGGWKNLNNKEFCNVFYSSDIIRVIK